MSHDRGCSTCGDERDRYCTRWECPYVENGLRGKEVEMRKPVNPFRHGAPPRKGPRAKRPSELRREQERRVAKRAREEHAFKVVNVFDPSSLSQYVSSQEGENAIMKAMGIKAAKDLTVDSGDKFLDELSMIADEDVHGLKVAQASYGNSWKSRGGVGAFMMLARKWDRLENRLKRPTVGEAGIYDVFKHVAADQRAEGVIDDIRDLRRYLLLVEAELRARGFSAAHRDNK